MAKYGPIYCNWSGYQKVADPFRVLELAHQAGASCMEWHLDNLDHFSDDELAEFRRRSEEYGIELDGLTRKDEILRAIMEAVLKKA